MKKICVITGTRADFGLLKPLLHKLKEDKNLDLQIIATAMHLSPEFGSTISEIEDADFKISKEVDCLLSSDTATGISKSIGLAMIGFADAYEDLQPDLVVILGDRTEMLAAATSAMIDNILIAHIHGGETTEGAYDEAIRHSITKMSYWHFTSTETYKNRVIQLGEHPDRVFDVGAIGLDSINNIKLMSKIDFEKSIGMQLDQKTILVTYHPVTLDTLSAKDQFNEILKAIDGVENLKIIFTHANSDRGGRIINQMIKDYVQQNKHKSVEFKSLGQLRYLSALKHVDAVVGNSSSGIIEVPYFNIPTLNIGDRQKGRVYPESVIHSKCDAKEIQKYLQLALERSFLYKIKNQEQVYGDGKASDAIMTVIKEEGAINLKKRFYDLNIQQ